MINATLSPRSWFLLATVFAIASALRIWAIGGDLWIDEVWSLNQIDVARTSANQEDWLALFFHSNTHALNTLYMAIIGADGSSVAYRFLSLITGIASLGVAIWIGARQSVATALIAAVLFGLSYPMINYSGEARGYGPMMFFALAGYALLVQYFDRPSPKLLIGFIATSLLGLMAHLTFGVVIAGFGFWALLRIYTELRSTVKTIAKLVMLFGTQLVFLTAYGAIALNNMVRGGDCCPEPALPSIRIMTYWTFGFDAYEVTSLWPLLLLAIAALVLVVQKARIKNPVWVFYAVVLFVFPVLVLVLESSPQVIHRYFLPTVLFGLLIFAYGLGAAWDGGRLKRTVALIFLAGFILGQGGLLLKFSDGGRGQYGKLVRAIAAASQGPQRITGFPTFSVSSVFEYQAKYMKLDERLKFVPTKKEGDDPADWFINGYLYGKQPEPVIERNITGNQRVTYKLIETYPQWGLSGDTWALYRHLP